MAVADENEELLKVLLDNGAITREQYDRLEGERKKRDGRAGDVRVTTDGGLRVSSYEGEFAFEVGAFLAVDAAFYDEKANPLGNGARFRSARIDLGGTLFSEWDYEFSLDFADAKVDIKDAFVAYRGVPSWAFQFGQFKVPFSLEEMGSRKHLTFMERALPNALAPDRKIGAGAKYQAPLWTAAAGVFGQAFDEDAANEVDSGWTSSGRLTFAPVHGQTRVFHLGASAAYHVPNAEKSVRIKGRPESNVTDVSYLNTGKIRNVRTQFTYGVESAIVYGPFSLQGEFIRSSLEIAGGSQSPTFGGGYAFASWMITGESRDYDFGKGAFGRVKPDRTYGAFELALRYSTLNLNSPPVVYGGRENNITIGFNWYANRNIRLMANYVLVDNDARATDNRDVLGNDDPGVFQTRVQFDF